MVRIVSLILTPRTEQECLDVIAFDESMGFSYMDKLERCAVYTAARYGVGKDERVKKLMEQEFYVVEKGFRCFCGGAKVTLVRLNDGRALVMVEVSRLVSKTFIL